MSNNIKDFDKEISGFLAGVADDLECRLMLDTDGDNGLFKAKTIESIEKITNNIRILNGEKTADMFHVRMDARGISNDMAYQLSEVCRATCMAHACKDLPEKFNKWCDTARGAMSHYQKFNKVY